MKQPENQNLTLTLTKLSQNSKAKVLLCDVTETRSRDADRYPKKTITRSEGSSSASFSAGRSWKAVTRGRQWAALLLVCRFALSALSQNLAEVSFPLPRSELNLTCLSFLSARENRISRKARDSTAAFLPHDRSLSEVPKTRWTLSREWVNSNAL